MQVETVDRDHWGRFPPLTAFEREPAVVFLARTVDRGNQDLSRFGTHRLLKAPHVRHAIERHVGTEGLENNRLRLEGHDRPLRADLTRKKTACASRYSRPLRPPETQA